MIKIQDKIELIESDDGSHTLYRKDLNEHYHSIFGAIQESKHIFIEACFKQNIQNRKKINVLEVGFGTGLNALLTAIEAEQQNIITNYFGVEPFRVPCTIIQKINYPKLLDSLGADHLFKLIHHCDWNSNQQISKYFNLYKSESEISKTNLKNNYFNLIYYDAFAPDIQAELWTKTVFQKIYVSLKTNGVIITYSCKGIVKRALKSVGFEIKKLPGPKGKREILIGIKDVNNNQ